MRNLPLLLFVSLFCTTFIFAQDDICESLYLLNEGYYMKQTEFNGKGKETGSTEFRAVRVERTGNTVTATVQIRSDNGKKKPEPLEYEVKYVCRDKVLYADLTAFGIEAFQGANSAKIRIEGDGMAYPSDITAGMKLPDVTQTIHIILDGAGMMKTMMTAYDREILSREKVVTSAGTFDCYKISSTFTIKMIVSRTFTTVTYFNKDAGIVKTEYFNRNGKLSSYSEIAELKR